MSLQETPDSHGMNNEVVKISVANQAPWPEAGQLGIELIYKTEPRARAWYSGNSAFAEGAAASPSHPEDDLDVSLAKMEAALESETKSSARISVEGVGAALLYMRSKREEEKGVPAERRTADLSTVDIELAADGLCWIQTNVDTDFGESLRDAAIGYKRSLNGQQKRHKNPTQAVQQPNGQTEHTPRRLLKKQKQKLEKESRQQELDDAKQTEIALLAQWQNEHPPYGTNHLVSLLDDFDTAEKPSGGILTRPKDSFPQKNFSYISYVAENPEILEVEINDTSLIEDFLEQNNSPIVSAVFEQILKASTEAWRSDLSIGNPDKFMPIFSRWFGVLGGLSDDYRSNVEFLLNPHRITLVNPIQTDEQAVQASIHSRFNSLMHNTLDKTATNHPKKFINSVHELLLSAIETDGDIAFRSILSELSVVNQSSGAVNMLMSCTPMVRDIDQTEKLKWADIVNSMSQHGYEPTVIRQKTHLPKNIERQYIRDIPRVRTQLGIARDDENAGRKLIEANLRELIEELRSDNPLASSLYHKLQK